jgi:outer membrane immunogenic protein
MIYPGGGVPFYITGRADDSFELRTRWDASLRARLGYLVTPSFLLYATGGVAWQNVEAISTCGPSFSCQAGGFGPRVISDSNTEAGWTVGGGIETAFGGHWIGRAEYRYADFGTISNTDTRNAPGVTQVAKYNVDLVTHTVTFGLSYKFGDPLPRRMGGLRPSQCRLMVRLLSRSRCRAEVMDCGRQRAVRYE